MRYKPAAQGNDRRQPLLFVIAEQGPAMLASAVGGAVPPTRSCQRADHGRDRLRLRPVHPLRCVRGNEHGIRNAAHTAGNMAGNMADPVTGEVASVLALPPNGDDTSTLRTFNSLSNLVATCVRDPDSCPQLFAAASASGGAVPVALLQAMANVAKSPAQNVHELLEVSRQQDVYAPARTLAPPATGYTRDSLARNTGIAVDPSGNVWLANNSNEIAVRNNPFANAIVVMVGAAAPLRTSLIAPPEPFTD